jgi:Glycosyltransferase family 9 (heptosyltransferase)
MISCILIYNGKLARLNESVAAWQAQTFTGEHELIISNCQLRQRLKFDDSRVRIIQSTRQIMLPQARNTAIHVARGDVIVLWPEDDICLPNHLTNVAEGIAGQDWVWLDKVIIMEHDRVERIEQGNTMCFAFSKSAWDGVGRYSFGVAGASDRIFIGRVTIKFKGQKVVLAPSAISYIVNGNESEKKMQARMAVPGEMVIKPELRLDYAGFVHQFLGGENDKKIGVVMLGRNGDIINILPFLKLIHDNYAKPYVIIAKEFESLFDGISYATPMVLNCKEEELGNALALAKRTFQIVIRAQIWGKGHQQTRECESYNVESWREIGLLHAFNDQRLRPVFDKRDSEREAALLATIPDTGKPWLLVNVNSGKSSPCPSCAALLPAIQERWGNQYKIVDLSQIRGERLYDCIALLEKAVALVSIDTSWLHLAAATNIPVVALTNPQKWAGTVLRMGLVARISYLDAVADFEKVHAAIDGAVNRPQAQRINPSLLELRTPVARRVFHVVDRFEDTDAATIKRKEQVQASWDVLYETGALIPAHCWKYPRNAKDTMGDRRALPYLKDLLKNAMNQMDDDDIALFTNDDNILHPRIAEYLRFHVSVYGACSMFRTEFRQRVASLDLPPEQYARAGTGKHIGRDGFAFTKRWLVENWDSIPDSCLGASMWDIHMAALIRLGYGIKTTNQNIGHQIYPAEIPAGYTGHIFHSSAWNVKDAHLVPSNLHNGKLFKEFAAKSLPELKVTEEGNLA